MTATDYSAAIERVRGYAEQLRVEFEMPGLQIALTDRDHLLSAIELGIADLTAKAPVLPQTMFEFGSIGKSFTAICLLQMEEEGLVDFHAPVEQFLPWWSVKSAFEPITIHYLLAHTSGLIGGTDFTPEQRYEVWALRHSETGSAPGSYFHYSNAGYKTLGLLIEHVLGKPYGEVVQERIFGPLGMTDVAGAITQEIRPRLAVGYEETWDDRPRLRGHGVIPAPWLETDSGDGCLCASATDLAIYLRMLLNRGAYPGGRILTEEQFERMTTNYSPVKDGEDSGYGYALSVPVADKPGKFGHSGGMVGYISIMSGDVDTGFGAIAFTNSMNSVSGIASYALDVLAAASRGENLPSFPEPKRGDFSGIAGTYHGARGSIVIGKSDSGFSLTRDGVSAPLQSTPYEVGTLVDDRPGENLFPYRFVRDGESRVTSITHGGDVYVPMDQPLTGESSPELLQVAGHYRTINPWGSGFRIVVRADKLFIVYPHGDEEELVPVGDGYKVGIDEFGPERIWFDVFVPGVVVQARDAVGATWHRFFTP